jgi:Cu+-exporting ATPase
MTLVDVMCVDGVSRDEALLNAGAVEKSSEHPIARAIVRAAEEELGMLPSLDEFESLPGVGATGRIGGTIITVGREEMFRERLVILPKVIRDALASSRELGHTAVIVTWGGQAKAVISLADQPKPSSAEAIASLRLMGLAPILLTGDNATTARAIAESVGIEIDEHHLYAGVMPEDKVAVVRDLQERGYAVAMVGDGVNDAPALSAAQCGVAVDDAVAACLARHEGSLSVNVGNGITLLQLELLVQHVGQIVLAGLTTISERQARVLATQSNWHGVAGLSGLFLDVV